MQGPIFWSGDVLELDLGMKTINQSKNRQLRQQCFLASQSMPWRFFYDLKILLSFFSLYWNCWKYILGFMVPFFCRGDVLELGLGMKTINLSTNRQYYVSNVSFQPKAYLEDFLRFLSLHWDFWKYLLFLTHLWHLNHQNIVGHQMYF